MNYDTDYYDFYSRAIRAEEKLTRLRIGMKELGFLLGRNPDGVDDSVDATLLIVKEYKDIVEEMTAYLENHPRSHAKEIGKRARNLIEK